MGNVKKIFSEMLGCNSCQKVDPEICQFCYQGIEERLQDMEDVEAIMNGRYEVIS